MQLSQAYTTLGSIQEKPNPLDYISDIISFLLVAKQTDVLCRLQHAVSKGKASSIDVGGDMGIHSALFSLSVEGFSPPHVVDIRNRVHMLDLQLLSRILLGAWEEVSFSNAIDMYKRTWGSEICTETLSAMQLKIRSGISPKTPNHVESNFFGYNPVGQPVHLISSFSSLDYFRIDDFLAKCRSIQETGGLLLLWIPSLLFHFNCAGFLIDGVISAPVSLSLDELFIKSSLISHERLLSSRIESFINYQLGQGAMSLHNYTAKLLENGYTVINAVKYPVAIYHRSSKMYVLNHYNTYSAFSKESIQHCLSSIRRINSYLGPVDINDIFSPYYYILAEKVG